MTPADIAAQYNIDPDIRRALEALGDPNMVRYPVHTPQENGRDIERETFRWFVNNDGGRGQFLNPIEANSGNGTLLKINTFLLCGKTDLS